MAKNSEGWFSQPDLLRYFALATVITSVIWIPASIIAASNDHLMPSPVTFVELVIDIFAL